jgi:anti-sigma factor RsiW
MKCEKIQRDILLGQAGDLSARELENLREHLASCESCRKYSADAEKIMSIAATSLSVAEPSPAVTARILAVAREEAGGKVVMFPGPSLRWALCAAAAVFVMCGAGLWMLSGQTENSASQVSAIVLTLGSEEQLNAVSLSGKAEKDQELQALASHLLLMEGFWVDEFQEVEFIDAGDELRPTALRSRSIDVFELQRCV